MKMHRQTSKNFNYEIVLLAKNKAFILCFLKHTRVTNLRLHALQYLREAEFVCSILNRV